MCGKLPHVETLSSPDNYSLALFYLLHANRQKLSSIDEPQNYMIKFIIHR